MSSKTPRTKAPRYGIGEWYGRSFLRLSRDERVRLADIAISHTSASKTDMPCPFKSTPNSKCTKKGGVCSIRAYKESGAGSSSRVDGELGELCTVCPHRFKQGQIIDKKIAETILETSSPRIVSEMRFLKREPTLPPDPSTAFGATPSKKKSKEDVGNIDEVLIHPEAVPMRCLCQLLHF